MTHLPMQNLKRESRDRSGPVGAVCTVMMYAGLHASDRSENKDVWNEWNVLVQSANESVVMNLCLRLSKTKALA